jgi:hypothetical protein
MAKIKRTEVWGKLVEAGAEDLIETYLMFY